MASANKPRKIKGKWIVTVIAALILAVGGVIAALISRPQSQTLTPTATVITTPALQATTFSSATPISTSALSSQWRTLQSPYSPLCSHPNDWTQITPQATCVNGTLMMTQVVGTFAELDLTHVNGTVFNLIKFRVQVHVIFLANIDKSTAATLYVQLSQPLQGISGYLFELYPDSTWDIQHVRGEKTDSGTGIEGSEEGTLAIGQPTLTMATMTIEVQNEQLSCFINNQMVGSSLFLGSNPSAFGLMVDRQHNTSPPSSSVQYSQFELDG